jgi:hypothetical protein
LETGVFRVPDKSYTERVPDKPNATRTAAQPEVRPFPPRYWWLKRIGLAAALLLVLLGVVRWVWGSYADRRLREQIEEYRAAGEPVLVQDFQAPPVPDEQNAAVLYRQAFSASVHPNDVPFSFVDVAGRVDVVRALPGQIERILEANAGALRLVRAAREPDDQHDAVFKPSAAWLGQTVRNGGRCKARRGRRSPGAGARTGHAGHGARGE